jgi:alkylation response protein AidB-like acyl-CoA dehydrogenase
VSHFAVAFAKMEPSPPEEATSMQLELSAEDAAFRDEMRTFFTTQVDQDIRDGVAARRELTKEQMVRSQQTLNAAGLAVPHWPEEWGGRGWSPLRRHIWHEEMQRACVPPPLAFNASMVGPVIAAFGSQQQKERFLPATANLDIWWSQGFSEPDAGSDLASLRTTAVRQGDEYVVNGQKTWTTLGQYGDWIFCLVRTDPTVKKQLGISFLLVDMTSPGVTVRPIELIDGGHEVNEVWFEDVRVPAENLVGQENKGWDYAKFLLGNERVGVAPVGSTKRVLAQAKEWARSVDLLDDPLTAARIAELENELLALELTALRVVAHSADGKPHPASSVLKLKGTELQQAVSELVVDLAGPASLASGAGDDSDLPEWSRRATPVYLNLRKASIYGGSNEVQRQIIAKTILGL